MKKLLIVSVMSVGVINGAVATSATTTCPDCYKCVKYSGANCTQCQYDANYCATVEYACAEPQTWCASANECRCPMLCSDSAIACQGTVNPTTCECEILAVTKCLSGQYSDGQLCQWCPGYSSSVTTTCTPDSSGSNGIASCYYPQGCEFTDDTGIFVLTSDCKYSLDESESGSSSSTDISGTEIGGFETLLP